MIAQEVFADGRTVDLAVYRADCLERPVQVLGAEGAPLVGMALLSGSEPKIRAEGGGEVLFEELP